MNLNRKDLICLTLLASAGALQWIFSQFELSDPSGALIFAVSIPINVGIAVLSVIVYYTLADYGKHNGKVIVFWTGITLYLLLALAVHP